MSSKPEKKSKTQIAAQLYTLREFCKETGDTAETIKKLRKIGYRAVQMSGVKCPVGEFKKICDGEGMQVPATHVGLDRLVNDLPKLIDEQHLLGVKYVGLGALGGDYHSRDGYKKAGKLLSKIGKALKKAGLVFVYHNHAFEFEKYDGKFGFDILFKAIDAKYVQPEIDTYWAHYGGMNVVALIRRFRGRLPFVHLKDLCVVNNEIRFAPVGEGNLDWPEIIRAFKKAGTKYFAVEQDQTYGACPFECLKKSYDNLRKLGLK